MISFLNIKNKVFYMISRIILTACTISNTLIMPSSFISAARTSHPTNPSPVPIVSLAIITTSNTLISPSELTSPIIYTASPPHSPEQSSILPSQSHAPSAIPSPPHMPHSSSSASPPQSPLQSSPNIQFPSQS